MSILENKRLYLSLPIQYATDSTWRKPVKNILTNEFGLKVFDPLDDPKQSESEKIDFLRKNGNYEELRKIVKTYVRIDLSAVDHADLLVGYIPQAVCTTGTCHEIINSNNSKKITLLVEGEDKSKIATWYFGFIPDRFMFGPWEDLYNFLRDVNRGVYEDDDRFFFLYNYPEAWLT